MSGGTKRQYARAQPAEPAGVEEGALAEVQEVHQALQLERQPLRNNPARHVGVALEIDREMPALGALWRNLDFF